MEHFVVSARKYRPQTFKDVVGQEAITNTLLNAIENNHLAQALLFCGPRGVGKTTCARILAKEINKDSADSPDQDFSFNIFELDAASNNSVDDIRNLIDQVRIPPQVGKYKVYIIDEVHMLSSAAFNAFLKTLEEPPKHAIFILATTEKHKIIPTILSRCQIFDFKRITVKDAAAYLKHIAENQGIEAEEEALHIIAQKADGAMRDALSIFDRVVSYSGNKLTRQAVTENLNILDYDTYFDVTNLILQHNIPELLVYFNTILSKGFEGHHFITGLASHFRDLLVCKNETTVSLLEVSPDTQQKYKEQAQQVDTAFLLKAIELANECDLNYKASKNQRLLVELCLMQLASINFDGEKKNEEPFIIPASTFKETTTKKEIKNPESAVPNNLAQQVINEEAAISSKQEPVSTTIATNSNVVANTNRVKESTTATITSAKEENKPEVKTKLNIGSKKISGLSISSIKVKKELEKKKQEIKVTDTVLPEDVFTESALQTAWTTYVKTLENRGKKLLASNLSTSLPKLIDKSIISLEVPNDTMKQEIIRDQRGLLEFLKKELNNFHLSLTITVNEEEAQKYAFTPQEKFAKLLEKNPNLALLKKEFDLDL